MVRFRFDPIKYSKRFPKYCGHRVPFLGESNFGTEILKLQVSPRTYGGSWDSREDTK